MCSNAEASLAAKNGGIEDNENKIKSNNESEEVRELVIRLLHARTVAPMALAVKYNLLSVVKTLLNSTSYDTSDLLKKIDEDGARPLELALRLGHDLLVEPLVAAGDEMVVNQRASTPSRLVSKRPGGTRADHFKIEAGEQTMLHLAAASGNAHHCKVLCDAGADVNAVNSYGRSPLHLATLSGNLEALRLLLDRGVAPNLQDANGHTSLHFVTGGDLPEDILDVDLATFDDLELVSSSSYDEETSGPQNAQQMQQSISQRQLVTPKKRSGTSGEVTFNFKPLPLPQAERVVDMLLKTKINVHIPDGKGRTPLHVSVWRGALNITRRLLDAGADPVSFLNIIYSCSLLIDFYYYCN
jgi:ankyrin repeat protein